MAIVDGEWLGRWLCVGWGVVEGRVGHGGLVDGGLLCAWVNS